MNNEEKILSMLEQMSLWQNKADAMLSQISSWQNKTDVTLGQISSWQNKTDATLGQMQEDISGLKQGQTQMQQVQTDMAKDLSEVKTRVTKIENEHGTRLAVLGDGFVYLRDAVDEIREDVAEIKAAQESQDLKIKALSAGEKLYG
ncbi:MAG: hypothetical protein LBU77_04695 [Clostridiales bacterium]|nr:hypothetical protein [Clostridiales bacterium]